MSANPFQDKLDSPEALSWHLEGLLARDARLRAVHQRAGPFAVRVTTPGFAGMARIICGQQLSVASARAIWGRLEALEGALDPQTFLAIEEIRLREVGLSAGKVSSIRAVADAVAGGLLDFATVGQLPPANAIALLTQIKGVGPWTAEIYLMFCAGHPDVFPAGDLALQKAVGHALGLDERPGAKQLIEIAELWSPHRAAAALLFWRYFAAMREKEGIAL
jgi:DNA-3-methyladenine glycosylase II